MKQDIFRIHIMLKRSIIKSLRKEENKKWDVSQELLISN